MPEKYSYIDLRNRKELICGAAEWFHSKWGISEESYYECMKSYIGNETEYGWYLCLDGEKIIAGLGIIENDFHERKDLSPNICAVYTEEKYRGKGIAGKLIGYAADECRKKGISPLYLVTEHTGFYERFGWEFLCFAKETGSGNMTRVYVLR